MKQKRSRKTYRSLAELPKTFVPVEEATRSQAKDAAWIEKRSGPEVLRITRRGRPPNDSVKAPRHSRSRPSRTSKGDEGLAASPACGAPAGVNSISCMGPIKN